MRWEPRMSLADREAKLKCMLWVCVVVLTGCAGGPQIAYESASDPMQVGDAPDQGEAQALEQAESDCARQGKHAESQRIEGQTFYTCADND